MAPAFQRHGAERCEVVLAPSLQLGLGSRSRPLAVPPRCLAAECRSCCRGGNRALWLRGCHRPACNQVWVQKPLCSAGSLHGATTPLVGVWVKVPRCGGEGASLCLWTQAAL